MGTALEPALHEGLARGDGAASSIEQVEAIDQAAETDEVRRWAIEANLDPPTLVGDHEVEFAPAWHRLLERAQGFGLHGTPWISTAAAPHLTRAAGFYRWSQVEAGHGCPISMTYAAIPALRVEPDVAAVWTPRLTARTGAGLAGMTMTEKQGGSDLRTITTRAERRADGSYVLIGEKWFCSAPMSDAFLVLARAGGGLTCFLLPRLLPDGTPNAMRVVRLKDKLGNRSNASAEIALDHAHAVRLGPEGRGVPTILEAVTATRLDCVLGSAALMRRALVEAGTHARGREAFGQLLIDQPVMRNVLADLALEQEAALTLGLRLATAVDRNERAFLRLALPAAKYLVCKRTPGFVAEALECFGGNGFTSDSPMPLLFTESPLNSIWEGSGSVQALDVLRALSREPEALDAWLTDVGVASGEEPHLDRAIEDLLQSLADLEGLQSRARRLAEQIAVVLQAALLVRYAPAAVAGAFCATRLSGAAGLTYGTLPTGHDISAVLDRALA